MWPELDTEWVSAGLTLDPEKPIDLFPIYTVLDPEVASVEVLVPAFGVAFGVPVVEESDVDFSVSAAISAAKLDRKTKGPLTLGFFSAAADGSLDVATDPESVTVSLASDVTFATDSAQLSAHADSALKAAAAEVAKYPSGGTLAIVGHTDDVADDAYNQGLSERRARAVSDRIAQLADLSRWRVSVEGKGESEPRVEGASDEARAANRRVEIIITAAEPSEPDSVGNDLLADAQLPPAKGPVGKGPEGVEFDWPRVGRVRLAIAEVRRAGDFLVGDVMATALDGGGTVGTSMALPVPFNDRWAGRGGTSMGGSDSLTMLVGGMRYLLADYQMASGAHRPLCSMNLPSLKRGTPLRMVGVWPYTGQDNIVIDLPGTGNEQFPGPIVRLTDIPVVES